VSDLATKLTFILERLPVAVALLNTSGEIVGRAGRLSGVLDAGIPRAGQPLEGRWSFSDRDGAEIDPSQWPCARSLRGEYLPEGLVGRFMNAGDHKIKVTSVPTRHLPGDVAAVSFLQQVDATSRSADGSHHDLEYRIINTLKEALRDR
jgi:hypothetical protein